MLKTFHELFHLIIRTTLKLGTIIISMFLDLILQSYKNSRLSSRIKLSICTKVKQVLIFKTLFKATAIGERGKKESKQNFTKTKGLQGF